jgi:hypothetical protein
MEPDNDMGNPDNITTETLRKAAKAGGNKNIHDLIDTVEKTYKAKVKGTPADIQKIT